MCNGRCDIMCESNRFLPYYMLQTMYLLILVLLLPVTTYIIVNTMNYTIKTSRMFQFVDCQYQLYVPDYTTKNLSLEMHFSHNNALVDKNYSFIGVENKFKQCCHGNFHQIFVYTKKWNMASSIYGVVYPLRLISLLQVKRRKKSSSLRSRSCSCYYYRVIAPTFAYALVLKIIPACDFWQRLFLFLLPIPLLFLLLQRRRTSQQQQQQHYRYQFVVPSFSRIREQEGRKL